MPPRGGRSPSPAPSDEVAPHGAGRGGCHAPA
jgi:hypothetical protein